jgi:isopenicillin-N N-acyltransferase-like protein
VGYSNQLVQIFNDKNFPAYPNHDLFTNLVFINKHVQPSNDPCMNDLMHYAYGSFDGPTIAKYVTAMEQTGDMHIAIYDWGQEYMYVSNAGIAAADGSCIPAYERPFLRFDMGQLWNTTLTQY